MTYSLRYMVPVDVLVDVDTKRVTGVRVVDDGALDGPVAADNLNGVFSRSEADRAAEIASATSWPQWEIG